MSENKAIDKANLELALSENNKRLLEHTDTADAELRQDLNMMSQYQKYLNIGLDYIQICFPGDTTVNNVDVGTIIPFNKLAFSNNLNFDSSTYTVKLNAGKTYKITSHIRTLNSSGYFYFNAYNKTQNKIIGLSGCVETPSSYNNNVVNTPIKTILSCDEDTEIQFKITAINAARTIIFTGLSTVIVEEINRQIIIDPVEHVNTEYGLEDAPVGHIISHMGTIAPKHYLICDGAEYNILDYPYLANHILDNFGSYNYFGGDGELTFCVPDLRGEFLRGTGTATRDTGSGGEVGEHQDGTQHVHICNDNKNYMYINGGNNEGIVALNIDKLIKTSNNTGFTIHGTTSTTWSGSGNTHYSSRPTNTSVLYCIKYEPTYYMSVSNTNYLSPSLYSKEERVVGCWIDGKPLYEKTITNVIPNFSTSFGTFATIENLEALVQYHGFYINNNDKVNIPYVNLYNDKQYYIALFQRDNMIKVSQAENWTAIVGKTAIITIRYTKTTDAENSFTDNMIKDYIVQSDNSESYSDEDINTAISETINLLNEE